MGVGRSGRKGPAFVAQSVRPHPQLARSGVGERLAADDGVAVRLLMPATPSSTPLGSPVSPTRRWLIAAAAVVMQICLGAAYGWSVFVQPLVSTMGWTLTQVSLNFTLAIAFLGVGTIIGGLWQDRVGPRPVATTAGIIYGISYLLAAYFASIHSLAGLYFSYGLL